MIMTGSERVGEEVVKSKAHTQSYGPRVTQETMNLEPGQVSWRILLSSRHCPRSHFIGWINTIPRPRAASAGSALRCAPGPSSRPAASYLAGARLPKLVWLKMQLFLRRNANQRPSGFAVRKFPELRQAWCCLSRLVLPKKE